MEAAFAWLGQIFEAILKFVPRIVIIRATHGGVKWRRGKVVIPMLSGIHFYWPLVTEVEVIPVARQTHAPPKQILTTKDGKKANVGIVVVYEIKDVEQAIGRRNWDVDTTVGDISQAAVVSVIAKLTYQEILDKIAIDELNDDLTKAVRKDLRQFGVSISQCKLIDFSDCIVFKLIADTRMAQTAKGE